MTSRRLSKKPPKTRSRSRTTAIRCPERAEGPPFATTGSHDHVARSSIQKSRKWWNLVRVRVRVMVRVRVSARARARARVKAKG